MHDAPSGRQNQVTGHIVGSDFIHQHDIDLLPLARMGYTKENRFALGKSL
jgi:hypothetical protein